jgi:hypothetical protein
MALNSGCGFRQRLINHRDTEAQRRVNGLVRGVLSTKR